MIAGCFVLTALLSETICARRELRDIPLGLCAHKGLLSCMFAELFLHCIRPGVTDFWVHQACGAYHLNVVVLVLVDILVYSQRV